MAGAQVEQDRGQGRARVAQRAAALGRGELAPHRRRRARTPRRGRRRGTPGPTPRGRRRSGTPSRRGTAPAASGGRPAAGVASESVARGEVPGDGGDAASRVAAGISSARSSVRLATANGPAPIGWRPNGSSASCVDRHLAEEVGRRDRLGGRLEEPAERRRQREHDAAHPDRPDLDLVPRAGARAVVVRVLEDPDGERDVLGRDGLAVVPDRVVAQLERPDRAGTVDRPALGEVRDDGAGRPIPDEPGIDQRDEIAIGLGSGGQRRHRDRTAEHALDVWASLDGPGARAGQRGGRGGGKQRRDADQAREDREHDDEAPDDERVDTGHRAPEWRSVAEGRRDPAVRRRGLVSRR